MQVDITNYLALSNYFHGSKKFVLSIVKMFKTNKENLFSLHLINSFFLKTLLFHVLIVKTKLITWKIKLENSEPERLKNSLGSPTRVFGNNN